MSAENPGCIHSAGALKDGKLSEPTYNKIIQDIKDAGQFGFGAVSMFPCTSGKTTPPAVGLVPSDLENKEKYPEFHSKIMGMFEKVALALDVKGNFSLPPPFMDPFALALNLDLDLPSFEIPDFPTLTPPDLILALNLKMPELPDLIALVKLPEFPDLPIPTLDLSINTPEFDTFFKFSLWPLELPKLVLNLVIPPVPNFVFDMIKVPPEPCSVIEKIVQAQLFGPSGEGDLTKVIAIQELATFTGQCATVAVTSLLVGDGGSAGITGNIGTQYKWREAVPATQNTQDAYQRNNAIAAFKANMGRDPTLKEIQFAQLIGRTENAYGTAWAGRAKKAKIPQEAKSSNNWGNIHGQGTAGSFEWIDYDKDDKPYTVSFAKFSSPIDGAFRLISELYKVRPYILDAINEGTTLYKPIYMMSSTFTNSSSAPPGALTYYVTNPDKYFYAAVQGFKQMLKNIGEDTEFDIETKTLT